MADRHKNPPIPFRPPDDDRAWLYQYAAATGQAINAILREALTLLRKTKEQNQ